MSLPRRFTLCALKLTSLEQKPLALPLPIPPESPTKASTFSWSSSTVAAAEREPAYPSLLSSLSNASLCDSPASTSAPAPFSSHQDQKLSAIVVGAAFAGLSAGVALARQGWKVQVLERSGGPSKHGDCLTVSLLGLLLWRAASKRGKRELSRRQRLTLSRALSRSWFPYRSGQTPPRSLGDGEKERCLTRCGKSRRRAERG